MDSSFADPPTRNLRPTPVPRGQIARAASTTVCGAVWLGVVHLDSGACWHQIMSTVVDYLLSGDLSYPQQVGQTVNRLAEVTASDDTFVGGSGGSTAGSTSGTSVPTFVLGSGTSVPPADRLPVRRLGHLSQDSTAMEFLRGAWASWPLFSEVWAALGARPGDVVAWNADTHYAAVTIDCSGKWCDDDTHRAPCEQS